MVADWMITNDIITVSLTMYFKKNIHKNIAFTQ